MHEGPWAPQPQQLRTAYSASHTDIVRAEFKHTHLPLPISLSARWALRDSCRARASWYRQSW